MRFWPTDPGLYLVERADLEAAVLDPRVRDNLATFRTAMQWAKEYLCRPHPQLGRKGPVCPFTQSSMDQGFFFLAIHREQPLTRDSVLRVVASYRDWFLELEPQRGP